MFTGLVTDIGTVAAARRTSDALVLTMRPQALAVREFVVGESISHDGVCLTVTELGQGTYTVLAGAETLRLTTLGAWRVGSQCNLERALRVGDRMGGHWVSGHVDVVGEVRSVRDEGANWILAVACPPAQLRHVVVKGSIAINGVSLTVNTVDEMGFSVALIPHTKQHTTLGRLRPGERVNLETDVLAKHVERLLAGFTNSERP